MTPEVQAWIEEQKPVLVVAAEEYVDTSGITAMCGSGGGGSSQLRNLLNIAQSERSLKVLVNFLRYQIGRGSRGWRHEGSGKDLEKFLTQRVASLCSDEAAAQLATSKRELEATLAQLFLGYVLRQFTYACGGR